MANYECTVRTNYFKVTDENRYEELFNNLCSEYDIYDLSKMKNGVLYHGFGSYGRIYYIDESEECDFNEFLSELQKILPEDEAFMLFEAGNEKLRYVTGQVIVATKKEIVYGGLASWAMSKAKELLGDNFTTQFEY